MTGERATGGTIVVGIAFFVFGTMWIKIFELVFQKDAEDLGCGLFLLVILLSALCIVALDTYVLGPLGWAI